MGGITHRVHTEYNEDNLRTLLATDAHSARYRYTGRNQLAGLRDGTSNCAKIEKGSVRAYGKGEKGSVRAYVQNC